MPSRRDPSWPAASLLALLLVTPLAAHIEEFDRAAFDEAASTILCDCGCPPQSVKDCYCGRGGQMREEIANLVRQGMTGEEVVAHYVELHGEKIRVAPTAQGFNLVAWLGPLVGLILATGGMVWLLRRWTRGREASSQPPAAPPVDSRYEERLRQALRNLE